MWSLRALGYSESQCLDFDLSVVDFWEWFEGKRHEKVQVPESRDPYKTKPKHVWIDKYTTEAQILALYRHDRRSGASHIDPLIATMTPEALDSFLDEWDADGATYAVVDTD